MGFCSTVRAARGTCEPSSPRFTAAAAPSAAPGLSRPVRGSAGPIRAFPAARFPAHNLGGVAPGGAGPERGAAAPRCRPPLSAPPRPSARTAPAGAPRTSPHLPAPPGPARTRGCRCRPRSFAVFHPAGPAALAAEIPSSCPRAPVPQEQPRRGKAAWEACPAGTQELRMQWKI